MAIFVSQVEAKSQTHKIVKSQNLIDYLRFRPNFFFSCEINLYSCMHTQIFKVKEQSGALKLNPGNPWIYQVLGAMADRVNKIFKVRLQGRINKKSGAFQLTKHGQLQGLYQNYLKEPFEKPFSSRAAWKFFKKHFGRISATSSQYPSIETRKFPI